METKGHNVTAIASTIVRANVSRIVRNVRLDAATSAWQPHLPLRLLLHLHFLPLLSYARHLG